MSGPSTVLSTGPPSTSSPVVPVGISVAVGASCVPDHTHGPECGHTEIQHGDHAGYLHDGHLHCRVQTVLVKHVLESERDEKFGCDRAHPMGAGHHEHSPGCGHERVPHDDHFDFLVGDELHHQHDGHCDSHGRIRRRVGTGSAYTAVALVADDDDDMPDLETRPVASAAAVLASSLPLTYMSMVRRKNTIAVAAAAVASHARRWYHDPDTIRFVAMFFLTGSFFFVELIWGVTSGSLALVADAMHMLSDLIALFVGFYALRVGKRLPTDTHTYGWTRMEVVAALMNGTFLIGICFSISLEAIERFIQPEANEELSNNAATLLWIAVGGLGMNLLGLCIFGHGAHGHSHGGGGGGGHGHAHGGHGGSSEKKKAKEADHGHAHADGKDHGHSHAGGDDHGHAHGDDDHAHADAGKKAKKAMNLNMHGLLLHVAGDALGSVAVIISMCVIEYTSWSWKLMSDPICSLVISVLILASSVPLVKTCIGLLLQKTPDVVDLKELRAELRRVPEVVNVHELHVWSLNTDKLVASAHVIMPDTTTTWSATCDRLKLIFHSHGIHNSTLQPEFIPSTAVIGASRGDGEQCYEPLCGDEDCATKFCCPPISPAAAALTFAATAPAAPAAAGKSDHAHAHAHDDHHGHSHAPGSTHQH